MALSLEEQKIIQYGRDKRKDKNEIMEALTKFRIQNPPRKEEVSDMSKTGMSEIGVDIAETLGNYVTTLKSTGERIVDIVAGEKTFAEKAVGIGAETFRGVGRSIGELAIGAGKVVLPERAERAIERGVVKVGEKVGESKFVQNLVQKYQQLPPDIKEQVDNALGFAEGLAEIGTGGAVSRTGRRILGKGVEISEEAITKGVKRTTQGIEGITPRALKNTYQRISPIDRDRLVKVQMEAIRDSFFKDRPVVNRKFDELLKDIARKDPTITSEKFISDFVNEGFMPRVEGRLARFDHVLDDIAERQGKIAESLDSILKFVPQRTKLGELEKSAARILRTSPQIGVELNKSLKELENFVVSLRTRYGDDLTAIEVNEIRKQMNRYTNAFEGELFMQDTADALADATRKQLDQLVPSGSVKIANAEIGKLMEFKKLARILDNRQIDIPIFGSQFGRLMGTLVASGIGVSVAGPGGLVIAGAAAFLGGEVIAQGLRELRFNPRIRNLIIQGIKRDEQLVTRLIAETEGENKAMLERLLLPAPTQIEVGPKVGVSKLFSQEEAVKNLKELGVIPQKLTSKTENIVDILEDAIKKLDQPKFVEGLLPQDLVNYKKIIREAISDLSNELPTKKIIPSPKDKGAILETTIPKELEVLAQEAKKYKSAEEFVRTAETKGINVPLNKIGGLEPQPMPFPTRIREIKKPVGIVLTEQGDYILESGNHRYWQAIFNKQETIPAKIRFEKGAKSQLTDIWNKAAKGINKK